jgi:hypothetical protein
MNPLESPCGVGSEGGIKHPENLQNHAPKRMQCSFLRCQVDGVFLQTGNRSHRRYCVAQAFDFIGFI